MKKLSIITLLITIKFVPLSSQSFFYVSTIDNSSTGESIIGYFDISSCKDTVLYTIQHEDFLDVQQFADIAVGTDGFLYLNSRPAPCKIYRYDIQNHIFQYVATFPNTPLSFYISSLTCDANGVLYAAGAELFSYDIQSGLFTNYGYLPNNVTSAGDLTFYEGRLLLLANDFNIPSPALYEINIQNPANSVSLFNLSNGYFGIFSYSINCDNTTVYCSAGSGQLFELGVNTGGLTPVCSPPVTIFGAATSNEFLASDCSVSLALDKDNSSGLSDGDYGVAVCGSGPVFISDTSDAEVYSGYKLDSLRFVLTPAYPNEILTAGLPLPPGLSLSGQGSSSLVVHNNGTAQYGDFQSVLRTVTWQYTGPGNTPIGLHSVVATLFATGGRRDTSFALLDIQEPVSAGRDTAIVLCADAEPIHISSLLSVEADFGGTWQPALPGALFDPATQQDSQFLYIVSGNECQPDTAVITVTVQPLPAFSFGNDTSLCTGDTLLLTPFLPALWQDGSLAAYYSVNQSGLYWAEVTNASGCNYRDSINISLISLQNTQENIQRCYGQLYTWNGQVFQSDTTVCAVFSAFNGCDSTHCITLNFLSPVAQPLISGDTVFCPRGSTTLYTSGFVAYQWSVPGATGDTLQVNNSGLYTVTATDANGCTATATQSVTESSAILSTWELVPPDCAGAANGWIELLQIQGGASPFSYSLNNAAPVSEPFFENLSGGVYIIYVMDAEGCTADTLLALDEPLPMSVSLGPDVSVAPGATFQLTAQVSGGQGALTYLWSPATGLDCSDCPNPLVTPLDTILYLLTVTDANGCSAADSIRISVQNPDFIYIPNVFSPDGDGKNDFFGVFADTDKVRAVELLRVYDRWGSLVYESSEAPINDLTKGWNGTFREKLLIPGIYVWYATIRLADGMVLQKTGDVLLKR